MQDMDEFIHDLIRHLTNSVLIADEMYEEHKSEFSQEVREKLSLLIGELDKMTKIIKNI